MYLHKKTYISAALQKAFMAFVMAVVLPGCVYDSYPPDAPQEDETPSVFLTLSVATADAAEPSATRADSYYFEDAQTPYEKINHLRVIICDDAGTVKYNRMVVYLADGSIKDDNLTFEVDPGKYSIHLFANERSLPEDVRQYFYDAIPGAAYPSTALNDVELTRENGSPLYGLEQYLPMAESFDITVAKPTKEMERYRTEKLFVTRVPVKFTFALKEQPTDGLTVRIERMAKNQYYLPHGIEYSPTKYTAAPGNKRLITKYEVPADAGIEVFEINYPTLEKKSIGNDGKGDYYVSEPVYLCETGIDDAATTGGYRISLKVGNPEGGADSKEEWTEWTEWKELPNLPSLPRNTHVIVRINNGAKLDFEVRLVPYTGCYLEPYFGLERGDDNQN